MLTIIALADADSVIVPVQAQYLPAKGMTQLMQTIGMVRKQINPTLKVDGVLLTLADMRTNLARLISETLRDNYLVLKDIFDIVYELKALVKTKNPDALLPWMKKVTTLGISEFKTFVAGLKQDIDAVMNAIAFNYSNGLVEGTINKIKSNKHIMYGRCRFDLLQNKCLILDYTE